MSRFLEAINNPLQKTGEHWQKAHEIVAGLPRQLLVPVEAGEDMFLATPATIPKEYIYSQWSAKTPEERQVLSAEFQIAARTSGRKGYKDGDPLYLIVNGNFRNPTLMFGENNAHLIILGNDSISDVEDTDRYLPTILDTIKRASERTVDSYNFSREGERKRRKRTMTSIGGVAATAALALGGWGLWSNHQNNRAEAREEARTAYDALDIDIPGEIVESSDLAFVQSDLGFFSEEIPEPTDHDEFQSPRLITLSGSEDCTDITTIDPDTEAIKAVTDAAGESLFIAVNSAGETQACFFGDMPSSSSDFPKLAAQVVQKDRE